MLKMSISASQWNQELYLKKVINVYCNYIDFLVYTRTTSLTVSNGRVQLFIRSLGCAQSTIIMLSYFWIGRLYSPLYRRHVLIFVYLILVLNCYKESKHLQIFLLRKCMGKFYEAISSSFHSALTINVSGIQRASLVQYIIDHIQGYMIYEYIHGSPVVTQLHDVYRYTVEVIQGK